MEKKCVIITTISLLIAAFFTAVMPFDENLAWVSSLFIFLFALPSFIALYQWVGLLKGTVALFSLSVFALVLESTAVQTGYPYGVFYYTGKIGTLLFGLVPWTVPLAWIPLVLGTAYLASHWGPAHLPTRCILSGLLLVAVDMVLDPAAVDLNFWVWANSGFYYQIPLTNFAGWLLSGTMGTLLLWTITTSPQNNPIPNKIVSSLYFILVFWTAICAFRGLVVPAVIGLALVAFIVATVPLPKLWPSFHWQNNNSSLAVEGA